MMMTKKFVFSAYLGNMNFDGFVEAPNKERAMEKIFAFKDSFNLATKTFGVSFYADVDEFNDDEIANELILDNNVFCSAVKIARSENGYDEDISKDFNQIWNTGDKARYLMTKAIKILVERDMEELASEAEYIRGNETYEEAVKAFGEEENLIDFYINRIADDNDRRFVMEYARPYNNLKKS